MTVQTRASQFGDGFFESILVIEGKIPLLAGHWTRALRTASFLHMDLSETFDTKENLADFILEGLSSKSCLRCRLDIWRAGGGRYLPEHNHTLQEVVIIPYDNPFNREFLIKDRLEVAEGIQMYSKGMNRYKTVSKIEQVLLSIEAQEKCCQDLVVLNELGQICEAISSNIFFIDKKGDLWTPGLSSGCLPGVMREYIIQVFGSGMTIHESVIISSDLPRFVSCFVCNAIQGIVPVNNIMGYQFNVELAKNIHKILIDKLLGKSN